jgi:RsiW-degrading membrane proteinase PrsW (M82 family)
MEPAIYFSFLVSPVILIVAFIFVYYYYKPGNWKNIRNAVLLGMLSTVVILAANLITNSVWHGHLFNLRRVTFFVFMTIAFSAELGKFIPLRYVFYQKPGFRGPLEGIRYSVIISLGYSMVAVILLAFNIIGTDLLKTPWLFLFTYPLANFFFGIVMGFFLGLGKFRKNLLIIDEAVAIFATTFFHGIYYFCFISSDIRLFFVMTIGFIIIGIMLLMKSMSFNPEDN